MQEALETFELQFNLPSHSKQLHNNVVRREVGRNSRNYPDHLILDRAYRKQARLNPTTRIPKLPCLVRFSAR